MRSVALLTVGAILATMTSAVSQPGQPSNRQERGFVALDQALRDLTNPFTVMSVVPRPGDEDAGTLVYHRRKLGARVVNVFATRGEAGPDDEENEPSDETAVGRSRQMLAASLIEGADIYCLNLKDAGSCENADQTLSLWGAEEALRRLVRAIRLIRPDAIVIRNEQETKDSRVEAVNRLVNQAFSRSADKEFTVDDTAPWQVRRLFQSSSERLGGVLINIGEYNRARGLTYDELARQALGQYQISGPQATRISYHLIRSAPAAGDLGRGSSLFDGVELPENLARSLAPPKSGEFSLIDAAAGRTNLLQALLDKLVEKRAEGDNQALFERYGPEFFRVLRYVNSLERALALTMGVDLEISTTDSLVVPGQKFTARIRFRNWSDRLVAVAFHTPASFPVAEGPDSHKESEAQQVPPGTTIEKEIEYEAPLAVALTRPERDHIRDISYYPLQATSGGQEVSLGHRLVVFAEIGVDALTFLVPAHANIDVAPPLEMSVKPSFALLKNWDETRELDFTIRLVNHTPGPLAGAIWVVPRALTDDAYEPEQIRLLKEDDVIETRLKLSLPILKPPLASDVLIDFRREKPAPQEPVASVTIKVRAADIRVSQELQVGYTPAPDSDLGQALTMLGVRHQKLALEELRAADLSRYQTLILDAMVYKTLPDLGLFNSKLRAYVENGGNLVLFRQRPGGWDTRESRVAPFPIVGSMARICDERAPVKFIDPAHQLVTTPNGLTDKDFEGWVYDRATHVVLEWTPDYTPILESGDPGQMLQGGLLVARSGRGTFIYCGYSLDRQLKANNIGAYRILANLISLPLAGK